MEIQETPTPRSEPYSPQKVGWIRARAYARAQLRRYPAVYSLLARTWRDTRFLIMRCRWKLEQLVGSWFKTHVRGIDIDRVYWISPQRIVFSALREFNLHRFKGRILGGDWDNLGKRFDSLDLYVAIREVCVEARDWTSTVYYQRILSELNKGKPLPGWSTEMDLQDYCKRIESLYHSIQENGYVSQKELFLAGKIQDPLEAEEETTVSVGRYGDLLFSDGAHRLAIAKLLQVPLIPVKITVRHREWVRLREKLIHYGQERDRSGRLRQPVLHPDLAGLPASRRCEEQFRLIKRNTSFQQGSVLDLGANLGYFCHRLEEEGFDCTALEDDPAATDLLKALARAENRRFKIVTKSILDAPELLSNQFDVVLALNSLHPYLVTRESHEKLTNLLRQLQMKELFFEPHCPADPQMQGAYRNYTPDEFVGFIMCAAGLKKATLLFVADDGRPLYKLE